MSEVKTELDGIRRRTNMELRVSGIVHNPMLRYLDPDVLLARIMQVYDEVMNGKEE